MMRHDVRTALADMPVSAFRDAFPLGSTARAVAVDNDGRYAGMVLVPEAHGIDLDASMSIRYLLHHTEHVLVPSMTIRTAVEIFDVAEAEALAVVGGPATRRVVGLLTEAHALRRYSEESELRRRELLGEA